MRQLVDNLRTRLVSDDTFITLMGNPSGFPYRVFYVQPPEQPVFPEVVFSFPSGDSEEGSEMYSTRLLCTMAFYSEGDAYDDLAERAVDLLHLHRLSDEATVQFGGVIAPTLYYEDFNVYGRTDRYIIYRRRVTA